MADSTLDMTGEQDPVTTLGHGTGALGPSDSSDSGSDTVGGPGMDEGLSDEQSRRMPRTTRATAGRDLGDLDLDADTDRAGTGERGSSGVAAPLANDLSTTMHPGIESGADEFDDPDAGSAGRESGDMTDVAADPTGTLDDDEGTSVADGAT